MKSDNKEIEVRFLEIDIKEFVTKLKSLGAVDYGEDLLREIVFYDKDLTWQKSGKQFVRIRASKDKIQLAYKSHLVDTIDGAVEVEFEISSVESAKTFLEQVGLVAVREQEKRRHTFILGSVTVDIDTWPKIPTYVELEGPSEKDIKQVAKKLGFDWSKAIYENARKVIENYYHIPVGYLKYFTFEKVE